MFSLSSGICLSFVGNASGENAQGLFAFGYSLAQLVTAIQAGFSTYWGPYVYSHYRDEQERICRVHDVLNLLIFGFFCVLVMFEDIVFVIFPDKRGCLAIFPLLMLAVVFNILCEGTVYGNSIARKPWHDTIGIGLGALSNFGLCALLVPAFGLTGAALALVLTMIGVPALAFALGMFIPLELNAPLLVGGLVSWYVGSRSRNAETNKTRRERGTLIASGFIAGGALMGVVSALLKYFGADWFATEWNGTTGAEVLSLAMYILLIAYFVRDSLRDSARKNNGS